MKTAKTVRRGLTAAILLLALLCPLPVLAARAETQIPVSVTTQGTATDALYTVEITPLDAAPAPAGCTLAIRSGGSAAFTGLAFEEPGDYRYLIAEKNDGAAHTSYDSHTYTVTIRVTGRTDGGLDTELWAVRSGQSAKSAAVSFVNRYDPPAAVPTAVRVAKNAAPAVQVQSAAATLPQTGDGFPLEALAAMLCAGIVGFGTAWKRR